MSVRQAISRTRDPHHVVWFYLTFPLGMYGLGLGTVGGVLLSLNFTIITWMVYTTRRTRVAEANAADPHHPYSP